MYISIKYTNSSLKVPEKVVSEHRACLWKDRSELNLSFVDEIGLTTS